MGRTKRDKAAGAAPKVDGGEAGERVAAVDVQAVEAVLDASRKVADKGLRTATDLTRDQVDSAVDAGLKGVKEFEDLVGLGRWNAEALMQAGTAAARGVHELNSALACVLRGTISDNAAALKAMLGCRSPGDLLSIQQSLFNINLKRMISDARRVSGATSRMGQEVMEPLTDTVERVGATVSRKISSS